MSNLITFGDSWTAGDCTDLIEKNIIPEDDNVTLFKTGTAKVYKNPWPVLLGEKLKRHTKNLAIPGNCNKAISTQIYDYHIYNKFNHDDIVVVSLSTWHREYAWDNTQSAVDLNRLIFENSNSKYSSVFWDDGNTVNVPDPEKAAYDAFFDFFTIKNFFESHRIQYYISWAFSFVTDFSKYLHPSYTHEITETKTLVEPFFKFCRFANFEKLMHPKLEDHIAYAAYLYSIINKDGQ